ncbi:MAG: tyrosine--tRNA ligase [candidate division WOR-3 bacterium]
MTLEELLALIKARTHEVLPEEDLVRKAKRHLSGKPLRIKLGCDPTRPDLHLGHYVVLRKLKELQDAGAHIIFIVGDFTGMIGDPSGQSETRPRLSREQIDENARTYFQQVYKVLDPDRTEVRGNSEWLASLTAADVIELASCYTVARMLERDDYAKRFRAGIPIYIHEFLYPLYQGYDSYAISADIETGGTDQKFNFLVGRAVQEHFGQEPQVILTMPLLRGTDGARKMSKSWDNYVGITESPRDMFGKLMSIPDELMPEYYALLLDLTPEASRLIKDNPREAKAQLARDIVTIFHSRTEAIAAEEEFNKIFRDGGQPDDVPEFKLPEGGLDIVELLVRSGLATSKSEARRLLEGGGVRLDGSRLAVGQVVSVPGILRVGKRRFLRLRN